MPLALPAEVSALKQGLRTQFDPTIRERGERLFRSGAVGPIEREPHPEEAAVYFGAHVMGSRGLVYHAHVVIHDGRFLDLGFCTCPYAIDCKHSAALALAVVEAEQPPSRYRTPDQWLAALRVAQGQTSPEPSPEAPASPWVLCYLVHLEQQPPLLALAERYRKKNGDWGRLRSVRPQALERNHTLGAVDRELLSLVEPMRRTPLRVGSVLLDHAWRASGGAGRMMVEYAVRSGRAATMERQQPLRWGAERALQAQWTQAEGTATGHKRGEGQRLELTLEPEPASDWQLEEAFSPPLYRMGLELGPVRTSLTGEQLRLIRAMPAIPTARVEEISAHLRYGSGVRFVGEEPAPPTESSPVPQARLLGVELPHNGILPALALSVRYGPVSFPLSYDVAARCQGQTEDGTLMETESGFILVTRDRAREFQIAHQLRNLSLVPYDFGGEQGELWVPSEVQPPRHVAAWNRLRPGLEALFDEQGWEVTLEDSYQTRDGKAMVGGKVSDREAGWFELKLDLALEGVALDTESLLEQWLSAGAPESLVVRDADDHWVTLDMQPLKPVWSLVQELYQGGGLDEPMRLPTFKAMELDHLEAVDQRAAPSLKKLRRELKNFKGLKSVAPAKHLRAELRDYQQQGLDWLMFLHRYHFGGILADDMGLGKTLQALAFFQRLKAGRKLAGGALVVAPTSLIWNWQREAEKFTPNLRCLVMHGPERKAHFEEIPAHDLVITTYGLIHRDIEHYADWPFDVAVLDEAQNIKNHRAKITRKVKQIRAETRLCLTGTPLENHLGELWSLADFALPGLLGDSETFQRQYRQPIEQEGDAERAGELSRRVAPFMLRRTKAEVVRELPQKTEMQQTIHLAGDQQALYESIRVSMEQRVRELMKTKGMARSRIEFLDALLKLRQACIDPALVKLKQAAKVKHSAKMTWLEENLPEMVDEGRRILVFSQFTTMLNRVEQRLDALGLETVKLTGRTRHREAAIRRFQDGEVPVFLISLKAGGAGLNLTAADTVVHVDPWWNPAVENQATDRAYRIGQDKPVFVYKLVAAGTVEEKIQRMQEQKQQLADTLFDQTREVGLPGSGDELLELFQ
ncbi:DEAD/DEAH box helicase [Marinimicrobium locisalis]|uniref:DEAD/DEAH box helicase n=1 Tax=Marinimicrobium locisalis TaxID=546022 RepID=UPI0032218E2A